MSREGFHPQFDAGKFIAEKHLLNTRDRRLLLDARTQKEELVKVRSDISAMNSTHLTEYACNLLPFVLSRQVDQRSVSSLLFPEIPLHEVNRIKVFMKYDSVIERQFESGTPENVLPLVVVTQAMVKGIPVLSSFSEDYYDKKLTKLRNVVADTPYDMGITEKIDAMISYVPDTEDGLTKKLSIEERLRAKDYINLHGGTMTNTEMAQDLRISTRQVHQIRVGLRRDRLLQESSPEIDQQRQEVLHLLQRDPHITARQLSWITGFDREWIDAYKRELQKKGILDAD